MATSRSSSSDRIRAIHHSSELAHQAGTSLSAQVPPPPEHDAHPQTPMLTHNLLTSNCTLTRECGAQNPRRTPATCALGCQVEVSEPGEPFDPPAKAALEEAIHVLNRRDELFLPSPVTQIQGTKR